MHPSKSTARKCGRMGFASRFVYANEPVHRALCRRECVSAGTFVEPFRHVDHVRNTNLCEIVRPRRARSRLHLSMATRPEYYSVLGVDRKADIKEIKRAYKRLAMRNHPDINKEPGAKVLCSHCPECPRFIQSA